MSGLKDLKSLEDEFFVPVNALKYSTEISGDLTPFSSKIGGVPYTPKGFEVPKELGLLAQINFSEIKNVPSGFPTKGILQFYTQSDEDSWGCDFMNVKNHRDGYKVIYHEDIEENVDLTDELDKELFHSLCEEDLKISFDESLSLNYPANFELIELEEFDEKYEDLLDSLEESGEDIGDIDSSDIYDKYSDLNGNCNQLSGYPYYTQNEIRSDFDNPEDYVLLFQIDSVGEICIGDSGIMNFFITKEELKNKDFSNVLFNWDCY